MPGKCHFQETWLESEQWRLWLRRGRDDYTAYCTFCNKFFDISHSGLNALKSHKEGKKHSHYENNLKSGKQMTLNSFKTVSSQLSKPSEGKLTSNPNILFNEIDNRPIISNQEKNKTDSGPSLIRKVDSLNEPSSNISSFLVQDSVSKAEILWAAYCVTTNTSTRSGALATDLFPVIFPDSAIAQKVKMHKDKISYTVTYGLGPYFSRLVISHAKNSPVYAISLDESLNKICQKQQMDLMINYWDDVRNIVTTRYLTSVFLERCSAVDLLEKFTSCIKEANLPLQNLVQVSTDGPNVNLKLLFDIKTYMKSSLGNETEILDVGTCSLHIVNNAYKTGHIKVGWKINQFLRSLYNLFKDFPSRRAIYCQITGSRIFPKKFCAIRWTENSSVIRRCLEMLPHLRKYINDITDPPASDNFSTIKDFLTNDQTLEAKLNFLAMIAEELEEFLVCFQRNEPLLPFLHQEVFALMKSIGNKFINKKIMSNATTASKLTAVDVCLNENILPLDGIDIGFGARINLKKVKERYAQTFKLDCKTFLTEMFKKLVNKSPLKKKVVLGASCLNPHIINSDVLRTSRAKIAIEQLALHSQISPAEGDVILREYNKFCENAIVQEHLSSFNWKKQRLDVFFMDIFEKIGEVNKHFKLFIQRILVCFHGNAAVERSFSFNKNFLVEHLEEKSLIAQRVLHDHIINLSGGLSSLVVNKQLMNEFRNSSSRRKEALQSNKEKEDAKSLEKKRVAQEVKDLKLKKQKIMEEKSELDSKLKMLLKKID